MRFLIAPDSFKESLSASQVAQAIKKGLEKGFPEAEYDLLPIGDGGEGTVQALVDNLDLTYKTKIVTGPFGRKQTVSYAADEQTALVEVAALIGLENIPIEKRNPLRLSTQGLGELISMLAVDGIKKLFIGVGGTATNDGGIGLAAGLGYTFFDKEGNQLEPIGANLWKVSSFRNPTTGIQLEQMDITVITDVTNPLCGKSGASYVFGPQKGLSLAETVVADEGMRHFYSLVAPECIDLPGGGAGGGLGAGLHTFAAGKIVSGIDYVLDLLAFDRHAELADIVIVGEGRIDGQSLKGKAPVGIAQRAAGKPVIAICGSVGPGSELAYDHGITAVFPTINELQPIEDLLHIAALNVERTAANIATLLLLNPQEKAQIDTVETREND